MRASGRTLVGDVMLSSFEKELPRLRQKVTQMETELSMEVDQQASQGSGHKTHKDGQQRLD